MKIEAIHDFHNAEYAQEWSDRFDPSADRIDMFQTVYDQIQLLSIDQPIKVLELGVGPGYLAHFLLGKEKNIAYSGLDFSEHMIGIARKRLQGFEQAIQFVQADLTDPKWVDKIDNTSDAIVTTWALHDLLAEKHIAQVYKSAFSILKSKGILINADFIRPSNTKYDYEAGRITIERHLELLRKAGFEQTKCIKKFEEQVDNPTTANNYACMIGRKST